MKAVQCRVWKPARVIEVENDLHALQQLVDGHIEVVPFSTDGHIVLICNEEGKLLGLEPNREVHFRRKDETIHGDFLLVGARGEEFVSLTPKQIKYVLQASKEWGWVAVV